MNNVINDSIEGSYDIPEQSAEDPVLKRTTLFDTMLSFIKSRTKLDIKTKPHDLRKEFGANGHVNNIIARLDNHKNIVRKTCELGNCVWFEYVEGN